MTISAIWTTPVRTFHVDARESVELGERGVIENRRFFLVTPEGARLRSSRTFWSRVFGARYSVARETLTVITPEGLELTGSAEASNHRFSADLGDGESLKASLLSGPWEDALSALAGHDVRIARALEPGSAFAFPVTIMSDRSVDRLTEQAQETVDPRRFKMLFSIAGCSRPHEEDSWQGRLLSIGEAVVRAGGPVPRCAMTTTDPDTGEKDLDTLAHIAAYRGSADGSIDFGIYGEVVSPGRASVGDLVEVL
jgi:uncharacterized protein YcbX